MKTGFPASMTAVFLLPFFLPVSLWPQLSVVSLFPANGATHACSDSKLRIVFDAQPVLNTAGRLVIYKSSTNSPVDTVDLAEKVPVNQFGGKTLKYSPVVVTGNEAEIYPRTHLFELNTEYHVKVDTGFFKDGSGRPWPGIQDKAAWSFTTRPSLPVWTSSVTVAGDGTGDFCTVQGAVDWIPTGNSKPVTILARNGIYLEIVCIQNRTRISIRGENRDSTVIAYTTNNNLNAGTHYRFLMGVYSDDFTLSKVTLHNTTPKGGSQAECIKLVAQRCVITDCAFKSFQDTQLLDGRIYIADSYIEGDVDFIWGGGTVYFKNCEIKALNTGYLVQARNDASRYGYIFVDCRLTGAAGLSGYWLARVDGSGYPYSNVAYVNCAMDSHIAPQGWNITNAKNTLRFWEYRSTDPNGAPLNVGKRSIYSHQLSDSEAVLLRDPRHVLGGTDGWNPVPTGVRPPCGRRSMTPVGGPCLLQNHPNRFNAGTVFEWNLLKSGPVLLKIVDTNGRDLCTLVSGVLPAGRHRVEWNAGSLVSGVYLARLETPDRHVIRKLTLLR